MTIKNVVNVRMCNREIIGEFFSLHEQTSRKIVTW